MTAAASQLLPPPTSEPTSADSATSLAALWDARFEWLSERLNPIVVKEARQALKSRQFTVTFSLLLVFGACWTALGVAIQMPGVFYTPSGPFMVAGYYVILAVPLLIIVPFVAFRSLAAEREDGTFELLSIATLTARQIVVGKLASAVLQMAVYYSAIAPCIAFTYLLRGLDIVTIALMLWYLFLASTFLSSLGLALATVTKERHWQVLLSVILVAGLVLNFWMWLFGMNALFDWLPNAGMYVEANFWTRNAVILGFHATSVTLFILVGAGQISFASDNRSTPIRRLVALQVAMLFGWLLYEMSASVENCREIFVVGTVMTLVYCWTVGSFLVGEHAELSPRVRRQLPQSFIARVLLTWFNPGSGTGYFFTLINLGLALVAMLVSVYRLEWMFATAVRPWNAGNIEEFALAAWLYMVCYLGVGRLIVLAAGNRVPNGVVFSFLMQVVLVTFGTLIPLVIQFSLFYTHDAEYTPLQATNPFWTLAEIVSSSRYTGYYTVSLLFLTAFAALMVLIHFFSTVREIEQTRMSAPQRVLEEEAAFLAARTPVRKKNPWDEPAVRKPQA
jgi:ABC-type transport system involved in cytochrome c biogenesis permease component